MGQGQETVARSLISAGMEDGTWVMLENVHLSLGFAFELEMLPMQGHEDFRLFLTAYADRMRFLEVPRQLMRQSILISREPPQGVRLGLLHCYAKDGAAASAFLHMDHQNWAQLLFTVCVLHVALSERRRFPQGWSAPYDFRISDLTASIAFLCSTMEQMSYAEKLNWPSLRYVVCYIIYGGVVQDSNDLRVVNAMCTSMLDSRAFDIDADAAQEEVLPAPKSTDIAAYYNHAF
jgi:dynein heavy chain